MRAGFLSDTFAQGDSSQKILAGGNAMQALKRLFAVFVWFAVLTYDQGNTFTKVRYNGGSVASKVDPKDWNNKLTVTPDSISLVLKDGQKVDLPPKSVTSLSYGQEAHRRVGTMIALAVLVAPVALFGLFPKTRLHYIAIQYNTSDGNNAGIVLQGEKDKYRAIVVAVQGVTGAAVSVGEKDREFVPVGVTTSVTKGSEESKSATQTATAPGMPRETTGTVSVSTN